MGKAVAATPPVDAAPCVLDMVEGAAALGVEEEAETELELTLVFFFFVVVGCTAREVVWDEPTTKDVGWEEVTARPVDPLRNSDASCAWSNPNSLFTSLELNALPNDFLDFFEDIRGPVDFLRGDTESGKLKIFVDPPTPASGDPESPSPVQIRGEGCKSESLEPEVGAR